MFTPLEIPIFSGGDHIIKLQSPREKAGIKAASFLTGITQIALTRLGLTHLLSMKLAPFD